MSEEHMITWKEYLIRRQHLISEFVELLNNMLYASEEDLKEIIKVAKEEYQEKLK